MIVLLGLLGILLMLYGYSCWKLTYLKKIGVKHAPPLPFIGNFGRSFIHREHIFIPLKELYDDHPNERFMGVYEFMNPIIVLRDLELIKTVGVKEYENFLNHRLSIDEHSDPFFGRSLLTLKDEKWRQMRATLSPAFTGSKMRNMFSFLADCADNVTTGLAKEMASQNVSNLDLEVKDLFTRYTNDVIGSCAFGLQVNSIEDRDNRFYSLGKTIATFSFVQMLKFFGFSAFPTLMKWFNIRLFNEKSTDYFKDLVLSNMKERDEKNIVRPDMIHLLMEAKKGNLKHETKSIDQDAGFATVDESHLGKVQHKTVWEDDDLVAQALIFFVAGFDTASITMNFMAYELALNPDVQKKLQLEIDGVFRENNGILNYNDLQELKYLDMVVSETLRKWPPAILTDRQSIRAFNLGKPRNNEPCQDVYVQAGYAVFIPIHAIHHDAKYWPNPEKFDPERFSAENKDKIVPMSYLPFGIGPRNCIGSRFALMEVKVMLAKLFSKFDVTPGPKTDIPFILDTNAFNFRPKNGCWLRFGKRNI